MKVKYQYTIHGEFILPTMTEKQARKEIEQLLISGDLVLIGQGTKYNEYNIVEIKD